MPELPEVETIKEGLKKKILGKKIIDFEVREKRTFGDSTSQILNRKILGLNRRAKIIVMNLSGNVTLLFHLKMTGQLIFESQKNKRTVGGHPSDEMGAKFPNKHTRVIIKFFNGSRLYFNDLIKFGYIKLYRTNELDKARELMNLGVEALSEDLKADYLFKTAKTKKSLKVKQMIMDQRVIAGVGNIYADESLFCAKIRPQKLVRNLSKKEFIRLVGCIKKTLNKAIRHGGTTVKDFVDAEGKKGNMQSYLKVYRKTGKPCRVCGAEIKRLKIGGRSAHYCPKCQR